MAYVFDGATHTVTLTTGTTTLDARDLYSRWKDWVIVSGAQWSPAFDSIGGDDLGGGTRAGDYYFLRDDWTIVPQDADHVLQVSGNIYPLTPGQSMFATRAGRNVQIQMSRSSLTQTIAVGSGVLPADVTSIATATRDAILTDGTPFAGANIDAPISNSGGLTIQQAALLVGIELMTAELRRQRGLDPAAPATIATDGLTAGDITQTFVTDPVTGTTVLTRTA